MAIPAPEIDVSLLPPTLAEMVEVIGLAATLKLADRFGGAQLWIPGRLTAEHPLVYLLGRKTAQALADRYALNRLNIPKADRATKAARDGEIRRRYAGGEKASALAREFDLTERWVWNILAGTADRQ